MMELWQDNWRTPEDLEQNGCGITFTNPKVREQYNEPYRAAAIELREWIATTQEQWTKLVNGSRVPVTLADAMLLAGFASLSPTEVESMGRKRACDYITGKLLEVKRERLNREARIAATTGRPDGESDSSGASSEGDSLSLESLKSHSKKLVRTLAQAYEELNEKGNNWPTLKELASVAGYEEKYVARKSTELQSLGILVKPEFGYGFRVGN